MIRYLQRLRAKRGFTLVELIVVIAVIGILVAAIAVGLDDKQKRIDSYKTTAQNFYSLVQTEFTLLQMYDGPLTMTLNAVYTHDSASMENQYYIALVKGPTKQFAGVMYYPKVKGNYPILQSQGPNNVETLRNTALPQAASIFIEAYVVGGTVNSIHYAESMEGLISARGTAEVTELGTVLKNAMKDRMTFESGYYIAKVTYEPPESIDPITGQSEAAAYREKGVKVEWAAFSKKGVTVTDFSPTRGHVLSNDVICGVYNCSTSNVGTPGSVLG